VTNNLSTAPNTIGGTWTTFKTNVETAVKKIIFLIFICLLLIDFYVYIPLRIKKNFTRTIETNIYSS